MGESEGTFYPPKKILIKADDFTSTQPDGVSCRWKMLNDIVIRQDVPLALGVIGIRVERDLYNQDPVLDSIRPAIESGNIELFNHGFFHEKGAFLGADLGFQQEALSMTNHLCKEIYDFEIKSFGAPFNFLDDNTMRACSSLGMEFVYFYQNKFGLLSIPDRAKTNPGEMNGDPFDPVLEVITREYLKRINQPVICLQIHPCRWSDDGFHVFSETIDWMREIGCEFISQTEYIRDFDDRVEEERHPSFDIEEYLFQIIDKNAELAIKKRKSKIRSKNLIERFDRRISSYTDLLTSYGFSEEKSGKPMEILDLGCGLGHMSLAFAAKNRMSRVTAIDKKKAHIEVVNSIIEKTTLSTRINTVCNELEKMKIEEGKYDGSLLLFSLNYALNHEDVVHRLSMNCKNGSKHLIRYHHEGHFFNRILRLSEERADEAANWAREHMASLLYPIGCDGFENTVQVTLSNDVFSKFFEIAGFSVNEFKPNPDESGNYVQSGEYLLTKEKNWEDSLINHMGDGSFSELRRLHESGFSRYVSSYLNSKQREDLDDLEYSLLVDSACVAKNLGVLKSLEIDKIERASSRVAFHSSMGDLESALTEFDNLGTENIDSLLRVVLLIKMGMVERAIEASEMMIEELGLVTYSVAAHNYACSYSNGRMKETAEMILRSEL